MLKSCSHVENGMGDRFCQEFNDGSYKTQDDFSNHPSYVDMICFKKGRFDGIMISLEENTVFESIEKADSIVFFGHKNPDGDCVGSVMGMKHAINELFPDKKVYGVGTHPKFLPRFIEPADEVDDDVIENSLAVILDLSDLDRVEDQRILKAKKIVCVDHHIQSSDVGFPVYRVVDAPSATFVLARSLLNRYGYVPRSAAPYLFTGLVTDTGRFQFDCNPETLEIARKLIECGVDYKKIYKDLYRQTSIDLRFSAFMYSNFKFADKVTYIVIRRADYEPLGLADTTAGSKVNYLSNVDDHPIWISFCELHDGLVRVELRSDGSYDVQQIAVMFGGGGHKFASGCRLKSLDMVDEVIKAANNAQKVE